MLSLYGQIECMKTICEHNPEEKVKQRVQQILNGFEQCEHSS